MSTYTVGIWIYKGYVIGYVDVDTTDDNILITKLFHPSIDYYPSRSYWDEHDEVDYPITLSNAIKRNDRQSMRFRAFWYERVGDHSQYLHFYLLDGSHVYTTAYRCYNKLFDKWGYEPWKYSDTSVINDFYWVKYEYYDWQRLFCVGLALAVAISAFMLYFFWIFYFFLSY